MSSQHFAGPYHRQESPTQTPAIAVIQVTSGEIWGDVPRGGRWPTVQAYPLPLPADCRGVQFTSDIQPYPYGAPHEARWYLGITPGVLKREGVGGKEFACITAVVENGQP